MKLIKSFKIEMTLLKAIAGVILFSFINYQNLNMSISERANAFYWGKLLMLAPGSIDERVFDVLMVGFWILLLVGSIWLAVLALRGKNYIHVYEDRVTMPMYFTIKEALFINIKHIEIKHVNRGVFPYRYNYWFLSLHMNNGKKYGLGYNNKRKSRFDEICELIKARIPPEAQLPPPKKK